MGRQLITVELGDATLQGLSRIGAPAEVVARLAKSAVAAAVVWPVMHPTREETDESLQVERDQSDAAIEQFRVATEQTADQVVLVARARADAVVQAAKAAAAPGTPATAHQQEAAEAVLGRERTMADAVLRDERVEDRRRPESALGFERDATDRDLDVERAYSDSLIVDQREANEQMVRATIRAQELAVEAEEARERAEASERELIRVAEFRELFIGILGHDLRNPLNAIGMAAALLLRRGQLDDADAKTATRIIHSGQRMTRMIAQLLDLTRARLGTGLVVDPRPLDLSELCRDVAQEFEVPVVLELGGDLAGSWDQDRLAEVLSNLVGNAVQYASAGTPVTLRARGEAAEVVLEVENLGEPISPDQLPHIFEPFHRARPQQKSPVGNLGLGLYIAHQVVLAHGGSLTVRSGQGVTTFVVRLPRQPLVPRASAPRASAPRASAPRA